MIKLLKQGNGLRGNIQITAYNNSSYAIAAAMAS